MADYPNTLPTFPVHGAKTEYPKSADRNVPNREIEAICAELGVNPKTITDATTPASTPASVAAYLDMLATIFKTMTGATNWYGSAVPIRRMLGGGGNGSTVAASTTSFIGPFLNAPSTTENLTCAVMPYDGTITRLYVVTLTAQPASGSLVFSFRVNQVDSGSITLTVAASEAAGTKTATGSVAFKKGTRLGLKVVNNATGVSAQIGFWSAEINQVG